MCSVYIDNGTEHMLGWDSALRHGMVLNPPLRETYVFPSLPFLA